MKNTKISLLLLCLTMFLCSCSDKELKVTVMNSNTDLISTNLIEFSLDSISKVLPLKTGEFYVVYHEGQPIQSQQTYDGLLLVQENITAGGTKEFTIKISNKVEDLPEVKAKVFGRYYPERKDDFAWENDRVGFRFYGKGLETIQTPSSALDLFYKRTPEMILDKWYANDISGKASYHVDHGEGCDPYNVGSSLGAGAVAPYINEELIRNTNYLTSEVLDNGPLRITFRLNYPDLKINDSLTVKDFKTISLDAGSQLSKIIQDYGNAEFDTAVGIISRSDDGTGVIVSDDDNYMIYAEPKDDTNGQIFIAVVNPLGHFDGFEANTYLQGKNNVSHTLAVKNYKNSPLVYYTGFGWDKYGFEDATAFEQYVKGFIKSINNPVKIEYGK